MTTTTPPPAPGSGSLRAPLRAEAPAVPAPRTESVADHPGPGRSEDPEERLVVARTFDEVPAVLPPGVVILLPGGTRMSSGAPRRHPAPSARPVVPVAPPVVVPPDAARTRDRAAALTRLLAEVLAGRRTPAQLGAVASPAVLRYLGAMRTGAVTRPGRAGAGRGGRLGAPGCGASAARRPTRVHVSQPHADAAEVCTTLDVSGRARALALRLDRDGGDAPWVVTAVRLL